MKLDEEFKEFFETLSSDPYVGMIEIFDWYDERLSALVQYQDDAKDFIDIKAACLATMNEWLSAHDVEIEELKIDPGRIHDSYDDLREIANNYRPGVQYKKQSSTMSELIGRKKKTNQFLELALEEKESIRKHTDFIQGVIDKSKIADRKKNALRRRLNQLRAEVEKTGTNLDVIMGGMLEVSVYAGEIAKNSKPVIESVKEIVDIVSQAKARQEQISLPKRDKFNLLDDQTDKEE